MDYSFETISQKLRDPSGRNPLKPTTLHIYMCGEGYNWKPLSDKEFESILKEIRSYKK